MLRTFPSSASACPQPLSVTRLHSKSWVSTVFCCGLQSWPKSIRCIANAMSLRSQRQLRAEVYTERLWQVSIKCNCKPGVWRLADNLVECTEQGCTICQDKPAQGRFMKRSGPHGFSKHCGMSADAIWRSAFKVEAAGETHMWLSMSA